MKPIKYEHDGTKGLQAISERFGIPVRTLSDRLGRGFTLEDSIMLKRCAKSTRERRHVEWGGLVGVPAIAKEIGCAESTLYAHLSRTNDIAKAVKAIKANRLTRKSRADIENEFTGETEGILEPEIDPTLKIALGIA